MVMVSTQTSLTCSGNDDLLPQSLLFKIITSKLAEAFELTNLRAKIGDYTDNIISTKRETNQPTYQFTCNYPDKPHLDLVLPADKEHQDPLNQGCFSPSNYLPRKRPRLNSTPSPVSTVRETIGLRPPAPLKCPNCDSTYRSVGGLNYHVQRCQNMVYNKPLTSVCKQLSAEPVNPMFVDDVPVTKGTSKNGPSAAEDVSKTSPNTDGKQLQSDQSSVTNLVQELEQLINESSDKIVVPDLVDNENSAVLKQDTRSSAKSEEHTIGKTGAESLPKTPSRKSNRIRSMNQRQIKSKSLLDRIKQIKRMDINGSLNNNTDLAGKSLDATKLKIPVSSNNTAVVGKESEGVVIKTEDSFQQLSSSMSTEVDRKLIEGIRNVLQSRECDNRLQGEDVNITGDESFKSTETSYSSSALTQSFAVTQRTSYRRRDNREKTFKCPQCSYAAVEKRSLIIHQRKHTGERPFKCTFCSYAALHKSSLVVHMRKHTGEKPFKCTQCPYEAIQKGNLLVHLRKHTGEKPFKCSYCSFAAVEKRALTRHQRTHSGEKPYKCNLCTQEFARKDYLLKHLERTHFKSESVEENSDQHCDAG